jgi:hypothetical protein
MFFFILPLLLGPAATACAVGASNTSVLVLFLLRLLITVVVFRVMAAPISGSVAAGRWLLRANLAWAFLLEVTGGIQSFNTIRYAARASSVAVHCATLTK